MSGPRVDDCMQPLSFPVWHYTEQYTRDPYCTARFDIHDGQCRQGLQVAPCSNKDEFFMLAGSMQESCWLLAWHNALRQPNFCHNGMHHVSPAAL